MQTTSYNPYLLVICKTEFLSSYKINKNFGQNKFKAAFSLIIEIIRTESPLSIQMPETSVYQAKSQQYVASILTQRYNSSNLSLLCRTRFPYSTSIIYVFSDSRSFFVYIILTAILV